MTPAKLTSSSPLSDWNKGAAANQFVTNGALQKWWEDFRQSNCQNLSTWVKKKPNPKVGHEFAIF